MGDGGGEVFGERKEKLGLRDWTGGFVIGYCG
jgi:hypothetical protein